MKLIGLIIIVVVLIAIFAFLAPVFPASSERSEYFGVASAQVTADVSLTFLVSHCGAYVNAQYTTNFLGIQSSHPLSKGYNFSCNVQVSSSSS
ncbi:MAG: hypothetical protein OK474_02095 [Thaumarchaeota archaeon]|nr:hypothetical protein [Nitrososphaerota archaeon]